MVGKLKIDLQNLPGSVPDGVAESEVLPCNPRSEPHGSESSQGALLYSRLVNLEKKSAGALKKIIEKWLKESAGESQSPLVTPGLIDPILQKFISTHYSDKSETDGKKVSFLKGERLYSIEEQRSFLEKELMLAAALEGLDDKSVITFVENYMDPKDRAPSDDGELSPPWHAVNNLVNETIRKGDPEMLSTTVEKLNGEIKKIEQEIDLLKLRCGTSQNLAADAADAAVDESENDQAAGEFPQKFDKFKIAIIELGKQRENLISCKKRIAEFLVHESTLPAVKAAD